MRVNDKPSVGYDKYPERAKSKSQKADETPKEPEYDVCEIGKKDDSQIKELEDQLERLRQYKVNKTNKKGSKPKHKISEIRSRMLSNNNVMIVRMTLSEAYREMAKVSSLSGSSGYDEKEVAKAVRQIKKVIAAGKMKVSNLVKEENKERDIKLAKKKIHERELSEMKRELMNEKIQNRKREQKRCGNEPGENPVEEYFDQHMDTTITPQISDISLSTDVPMGDIAMPVDVAAVMPEGGEI